MDVLSALENLGYPHPIAEAAIHRATEGEADVAFDVLFKRSLQILTKG
jgi:Holliday junction resolvasome RuvABC DNA-binding subunit